MLFDLPTDISQSILRDWLVDLKCMAALDAAAARSIRSEYLALLAHPTFVLPSAIQISNSKSSKKMIFWIVTRMIKLSAVEVTASMLKECAKISFYCLGTVQRLVVTGSPLDAHDDAFVHSWLARLLGLLPRLEELDMSEFKPRSAGYLTVIASSAAPSQVVRLKSIRLDNTLKSCEGVAPLIAAIGATVKCVDFGNIRRIDSATLSLIAGECTLVKELKLIFRVDAVQDLLAAFASSAFPLLERLEMKNFGALVNDAVAKAIFHHHPHLTKFTLSRSDLSIRTCADIIANHSSLVHFWCPLFKFDVVSDHCELIVEHLDAHQYPSDMHAECMLQVSSSRPLFPITHLECDEVMNNEDLIKVVSTLGADLKSLIINLNETADDDNVVQQITLLCPFLEVLYLNDANSITDLSLATIANNCKHIAELSLHGAEMLTDFAMCYLLSKIGEQLTELYLLSCSLTSASLLPILSLCNKLKVLKISDTDISAEAIQQQILSTAHNHLPKLESLVVDPDDFDVLTNFITNPINGVDAKWLKLLGRDD